MIGPRPPGGRALLLARAAKIAAEEGIGVAISRTGLDYRAIRRAAEAAGLVIPERTRVVDREERKRMTRILASSLSGPAPHVWTKRRKP